MDRIEVLENRIDELEKTMVVLTDLVVQLTKQVKDNADMILSLSNHDLQITEVIGSLLEIEKEA